jgi:hypothetical protein
VAVTVAVLLPEATLVKGLVVGNGAAARFDQTGAPTGSRHSRGSMR